MNDHDPAADYHCDVCSNDLTHAVRIKCAHPLCDVGEGVDICPACFCAGKEFANHKRGHPYRVIEISSYPIFTEDWGADEELLLIKGIAAHGFGNWKKIAEQVRTRTKEQVAQHYNDVYIDSSSWPVPQERTFEVDPANFQQRKRRRIEEMNAAPVPPIKPSPVSLPGIHEISGFFPGRLEFEHEIDNEAEDLVKDLEFGIVLQHGGDLIPEDENDLDVKARLRWEDERRNGGTSSKPPVFAPPVSQDSNDDDDAEEELSQPPPIENDESIAFKLTLLEMYFQRVEKRLEAKSIMYDRGLLEYKKTQAAEKKRPREERELVHRLRPFARLGTAADYEAFAADMLYEALLRKRIKELQEYRRLGLVTPADIDRYEADVAKRTQTKSTHSRDYLQYKPPVRHSSGPDQRRLSLASEEREATPKLSSASVPGPVIRRPVAPLNLASSPSLHLLTPGEQALCSQLRILPKPYLVIKETLVREYARRGGKLRRREARDLVKVDVNKTSRVWDFLVQAGFLKITPDAEPTVAAPTTSTNTTPIVNGNTSMNGVAPRWPLAPGSVG